MSNEGRKIKPVSFSIDDEYEKELLQFVEKIKNFSGYVKRLIDNDMRHKNGGMVHYAPEVVAVEQNYTDETIEAMSSFF